MKLTILGCGPSAGVPMVGCHCDICTSLNPRNKRMRASLLVQMDNGAILLIDASPDLRMQALTYGFYRIDALLITHAHADHCHGLDDVRAFNFHKNDAIDLYADLPTMEEIKQRFSYIFKEHKREYGWYKPEFTCHTLPEGTGDISIAGQTVKIFRQYHGRVDSVGIRIGNVAYSTDVKAFPEESFEALQKLDVWIVDCLRFTESPTHAHLDLTLSWIERLKPRRAILTHMGHEFDYDALNGQLPDGVEMAYDGMVLTL